MLRFHLHRNSNISTFLFVCAALFSFPVTHAQAASLDADADGYPDCVEMKKYRHQSRNKGIQSTKDADADGIPDQLEQKRFRRNHDNDRVRDTADADDDNDDIPDTQEKRKYRFDHDNDGIKDKKDADDDNDGIVDLAERTCRAILHHRNRTSETVNESKSETNEVTQEEGGGESSHADEQQTNANETDGTEEQEEQKEEKEDAKKENGDSNNTNDPSDTDVSTYEEAYVGIDPDRFSVSELTVNVGTTVTWFNFDTAIHTVTSDDDLFDSGFLQADEFFEYTFTTAGAYPYHCDSNPSLTGAIIVQ